MGLDSDWVVSLPVADSLGAEKFMLDDDMLYLLEG